MGTLQDVYGMGTRRTCVCIGDRGALRYPLSTW